ncbi:hypothetical protein D6833_13995, partial [Candidatus Parcubacteria bacterium]
FKGGTLDEFHRLLLFALSTALSDKDDEAKNLANAMRGVNISHSRTKTVQSQFEISLFSVGTVGGGAGFKSGMEKQIGLANPEYWVMELLERASKHYDHVVIAIDDLDKTDPHPDEFIKVRSLLDGALPILRSDKCAFILTGRTLTVAQDIYASILGIFHRQIQLPVFESEELCEIAIKTLNLVRDKPRPDTYPFSHDAISQLAAVSYGIPRHFNQNCADVLEAAFRLGYEELDDRAFEHCFNDVQTHVSADVDAQVRQLLYIAQKHGGFSQDNRRALDELGMGDFIEVLPMLEHLVQRDLLTKDETYATGIRFIVTGRAQKAATEMSFDADDVK